MEEGATGLQKVALARGTVELAPGAATGMTVGAEIPQPEPAPIVTIAVRTKVPGRVDRTGTPVGRCHGVGRHRRRRFGRRGVLCTQGAMALGCEGLGQRWHGRSRHRALGSGKAHDDKKPEECEQDERRENMMQHHGVVPLQHVLRWGIVPGFEGDGIIRRVAVHDHLALASFEARFNAGARLDHVCQLCQ
jgi:hypothetical protein